MMHQRQATCWTKMAYLNVRVPRYVTIQRRTDWRTSIYVVLVSTKPTQLRLPAALSRR